MKEIGAEIKRKTIMRKLNMNTFQKIGADMTIKEIGAEMTINYVGAEIIILRIGAKMIIKDITSSSTMKHVCIGAAIITLPIRGY